MKFQSLVNAFAIDTANNLHAEFGAVCLKKLESTLAEFFAEYDIEEKVQRRAMFEACNVHGVLLKAVH
tara:strand:- start:12 stop:215 length:204 start_codon:yes stop_codon:yes gene_type:complete